MESQTEVGTEPPQFHFFALEVAAAVHTNDEMAIASESVDEVVVLRAPPYCCKVGTMTH